MIINEPGVYAITDDEYHADPAPAPSLSSSMIKVLLNQSPRHAWFNHPRLNPAYEPTSSTTFDLGSAAHDMLLGCGDNIVIVDAADWRTKAAKELRDEARAAGKHPMLEHQYQEALQMAAAAVGQLEATEIGNPFRHGDPEQTLVWREGDIWCRAKLDWLPRGELIDRIWPDYKTTGASAEPSAFSRQVANLGYDIQAAWYMRGIRATHPGIFDNEAPQWRFIVQENVAPYALSVVGLTPATIDMANRKIERALGLWNHCLSNDVWPGYRQETCFVEAPAWAEAAWLDREARETLLGPDLYAKLIDWYAPHNKGESNAT